MKVSDAIALLKLMPQDADLMASTEGLGKKCGPGLIVENGTDPERAVLAGFSAEQLRAEAYDLVLMEKENIVVLALIVSSNGNQMSMGG